MTDENQQLSDLPTETPPTSSASIEMNWAYFANKFKVPEVCERFDDMNLNPDLLRGIYSYGFESPSYIQQRAINALCTRKNLIAQAQSGTGKTATFVVGSLNNIDLSIPSCQILVLAPTRELANQIFDVYFSIGMHLREKGLKLMACVGGTSVQEDVDKLKNGIQVVVGTPGRVKHMIEQNDLSLESLKMFILDEADEMLSRGFKEQIYEIIKGVNKPLQMCLFSATLNEDTLQISNDLMKDAIKILVKKEEVTLEGITQFYISLKEEWKYSILIDLYSSVNINQCIIYCNTKDKVNYLADKMTKDDHVVSFMHGDMEDATRRSIMAKFKKAESRVLISTDLNSRGIDVQGVSLVINYDLPKKKETYIHRIGRSGRFGRKGTAINFVIGEGPDSDIEMMQEIERYYSTDIQELCPEGSGKQ